MLKDRITGSKALMRALQAEGVKTIFGYPGGSIMPVYDALFDYTRGEKKPVCSRNTSASRPASF